MFQKVRTLEAFSLRCYDAFFSSSIVHFPKGERLDTTVIIFIPVLVVPRLTEGDKLVLCQLSQFCNT
jgi:hypothetical protein